MQSAENNDIEVIMLDGSKNAEKKPYCAGKDTWCNTVVFY
jgi:hypothetical protein